MKRALPLALCIALAGCMSTTEPEGCRELALGAPMEHGIVDVAFADTAAGNETLRFIVHDAGAYRVALNWTRDSSLREDGGSGSVPIRSVSRQAFDLWERDPVFLVQNPSTNPPARVDLRVLDTATEPMVQVTCVTWVAST